jgi:hypothetical protein
VSATCTNDQKPAPEPAEFEMLFAGALRRLDRVDTGHLRLTLSAGDGVEVTAGDLVSRS